jgi:tetratricopeptide (TPR) repeat protein
MESAKQFGESARSLLMAGDYEEALEVAGSGLEHYPDDGRLWEMRGIALGCRRDVTGAMAALETASTLVPLSAPGQLSLAVCYVRTQNVESAKCIYEFLATRGDFPTELVADLAWGLDRVGEPKLALEVCRTAVQRQPGCDGALAAMAHYMTKLDYPVEEVTAVVRRAFELRPDAAVYRVDLALLLVRCGRQEEAYQLLTAVDLAELLQVHCPPRLVGLIALFRQMDDEHRASTCESRVMHIMQKRGVEPP